MRPQKWLKRYFSLFFARNSNSHSFIDHDIHNEVLKKIPLSPRCNFKTPKDSSNVSSSKAPITARLFK